MKSTDCSYASDHYFVIYYRGSSVCRTCVPSYEHAAVLAESFLYEGRAAEAYVCSASANGHYEILARVVCRQENN